MKILIYSPVFLPSVGGLEFMGRMLAEDFIDSGHEAVVVTATPGTTDPQFEQHVVRRPSPRRLLELIRAADVVLHMNLSLKGLWPLLLVRRPLVIGHYGPYRRADGRMGVRDRLKYWFARRAINIACSETVKRDLPASSPVIPNAYDDRVYQAQPGERARDLVFVGRFVSDKGVDLLLRSLVELRKEGLSPTLTLIGLGPDEEGLRAYCKEEGLLGQVTFAGKRTGADAAALLNMHRLMVVPSRSEGLPIAALDGIACGCVVIGSDAGGLPEAIGECGLIFSSGDVAGLTRALVRALKDNALRDRIRTVRAAHLARFSRQVVARQYLDVLESALKRARSG